MKPLLVSRAVRVTEHDRKRDDLALEDAIDDSLLVVTKARPQPATMITEVARETSDET